MSNELLPGGGHHCHPTDLLSGRYPTVCELHHGVPNVCQTFDKRHSNRS
jgi:hypothetical protein